MYQLVYASSATETFSQTELSQLLEKARSNNHAMGITGLLLYKDGNFMQVLEGPQDAVLRVFHKVEADPRHRGIILLIQRETPAREFGEWSMGFKLVNKEVAASLTGYTDFLERPLTDKAFLENPSRALYLLESFKKIVTR